MKKSFLILHILIFVWMQLLPQNLTAQELQTKPIPPMPRNYRLPDMHLLDTVAFYQKFKDQVGKRVDVEGFVGRFGATFGEDFRKKIYEIEHQYDEEIEMILTLSSTIDDAKILQKNLEAHGKKMVIVEIPDWLQQKILEKAEKKAQQFNPTPLRWASKINLNKVTNPVTVREAVSNAYKIIKNQYVTPSKRDIKIAAVTTTVGGVISGVGLALTVGMDPMTIAAIVTSKALFMGTTAVFARTISNLLKADIGNELKVMTGIRKVVTDAYYTIGTKTLMPFSHFEVRTELLSESIYAVTESKAENTKEKKISEKASDTLFWYMFAYGTTLSILGTLGVGSEPIIEYGSLEVTGLRAVTIIMAGTLYLLYKHKHKKIEKFVELHNKELLKMSFSKLVKPLIYSRPPNVSITINGPTCQSLFQ